MRGILVVMTGLGAARMTGGLFSFIFGGWSLKGPQGVSGLRPFDGVWSPADDCFLGAILSALGAGEAVGGRLGLGVAGRA